MESDARPIGTLEAAGRLKTIIDADRPARLFMDVGGNGGAIADVLSSWGEPYASVVRVVNFGAAPLEPTRLMADGSKQPGPKNRRAEMWERSRDWLEEEPGAGIPDSDALQADACAPGYHYDPAAAAGAGSQGPDGRPRRPLPRRMGRRGADLRRAGG